MRVCLSYGHYHRSADDDKTVEAANTSVAQRPNSEVSPASTKHMLPTAASPTKPGHPVRAIIELPDTRVAPRDDITVKLSNSARLRELFEREAARARQPGITVRTPPLQSSVTLTSSTDSSKSVQVPQMVAYFDRSQTGKQQKAISEGTSETQVTPRSTSTDAPLTTFPEAELPAPPPSSEETMVSTGKIKLPQLPIERYKTEMHVRLPDEELAARNESPQLPKARHDDQSSTEPFSIDEMSRQRVSVSEPLSDTDTLSDRMEAKNIVPLPPSVPPRSKPSLFFC
ncbi:hypothetical protein HPB51_010101 [Rhipicephalus microplus]|uniref:Uncharacterized protein n=1 Tax=Rhipicephalus microplus TaxID=6941 RepID=A0A9J6F1D6_RHIMP|nr:hypothetical protein HPB51_010101 [Rhipicephalus microplus]